MSKQKIQFFMDRVPSGYKLIGYKTNLEKHSERFYWQASDYTYNGKNFDVHVINRSSVIPPIAMVKKMVAQYIKIHFLE